MVPGELCEKAFPHSGRFPPAATNRLHPASRAGGIQGNRKCGARRGIGRAALYGILQVKYGGTRPPVRKRAMSRHLIPGIYLSCAAGRSSNSERRNALRRCSEESLTPLLVGHGPFGNCTSQKKALIEDIATERAQFFQR